MQPQGYGAGGSPGEILPGQGRQDQTTGGADQAIQQELKGRPLSDVSTDKLLDILLRYYGQLKEEFVDTRPLSDREIQELKELG